MLKICDIYKKYVTGDLVQTALDGVSLTLRDSEFVAILGPSGSGKTTLLNVIGGLDRYDKGDLIINGVSTKKYTDRDWDSYRNHTIGFVFQSYNLIPHQTVLANVELALTISGISRSERRKRAKKALEEVGLGNQIHKRPNQMSGGQMQRVAIARALVNNPDILLADEPTGALDSETSVQIMDLLQDVAKDRLVVMVTHNPELAEQYANRIVRVRDGKIIDDSNPFDTEPGIRAVHRNMGRSSMSFLTALSLSFNNLRTKKARTLLTAFAGSIGIIGIALILSLSTGFQKYIDQIQEDTLSNYPLTIQAETADMTAALAAVGASVSAAESAEPGTIVEQQMISQMFAQIGSNDLASFKAYLESNYAKVEDCINAVRYGYGVKPMIFANNGGNGILQVNPGTLFGKIMGNPMMSAYMDSDVFYEMLNHPQMLNSQYQILEGRWPDNYNELVAVLPGPNAITDYMAYTLGLKDPDVLMSMIEQVMAGQEPTQKLETSVWTYQELMNLEFKLVPASVFFRYNSEYQVWENMSDDTEFVESEIQSGIDLKIVGIVCPIEGVTATTLTPGIAYLPSLTQHVIDSAYSSEIVISQLNDPNTNVFTGTPFGEENESNGLNFEDMISIDEELISSAFGFNVNANVLKSLLEQYLKDAAGSIKVDTSVALHDFTVTFREIAGEMLHAYITENAGEDGKAEIRLENIQGITADYLASETTQEKMAALGKRYGLSVQSLTQVYDPLLQAMLATNIAAQLGTGYSIQTEAPEQLADSQQQIDETQPDTQNPDADATEPAVPESTVPDFDVNIGTLSALFGPEDVESMISEFVEAPLFAGTASIMAGKMSEPQFYEQLKKQASQFGGVLLSYLGNSFYVDETKLSAAFQFNMTEDELRRLMEAMSGKQTDSSAASNLRKLGYADVRNPLSISIYMTDFAAKEKVLDFIDSYNEEMEKTAQEDKVIRYTDLTGIMMSSVRTIVDSVSYVLIAFVAVSLIVSSIMIGIITYISVMERTKEIGVLRAIGASKRNISQVFNAETFIIGLCSGLLGVGITLLMNIPINLIIHRLTGNMAINSQLPTSSAGILILLSMGLTMLGGLIPSGKAAKKDPVIALRSE